MKMQLKVPVNSYASAVRQIEAGADEIYMGLEDRCFQRMSYSARAQVTAKNRRANLSEEEFSRTVNYAHAHHVTVNYTANCQHVSNSANDFHRKGYLEYVKRGIELGADAVIVADIGNLLALQKHGIQIPLIAGSYMGIFNHETADLMKRLGVFRVCLPDQILLDEIRTIKENTDLEIEIFIGYGCSNLSGSCCFCHNSGEREPVGVTCRAAFQTGRYGIQSALDVCTDCAVCSIPKLYDLGINSLKLVGRESDCIEAAAITRMYKTAIRMYAETGKWDRAEILAAIPWWQETMCPARCKYEPNQLLRSYL